MRYTKCDKCGKECETARDVCLCGKCLDLCSECEKELHNMIKKGGE